MRFGDLRFTTRRDRDAVATSATPLFGLKDRARRLIHHQRRDEFVIAKHREARRVERNAAIAVRRTVDRIDDHGELAVARHARLFTHHSKSGAAKHTPRDVVGHDVEVILRRSIPRESATAVRLDGFANLVCALREARSIASYSPCHGTGRRG